MGGHPQHVCSRVRGRGRHWALRCNSVAVRARRRVRTVPDLQERTLALRTPPRSHRSRLPAHVRRPYSLPANAQIYVCTWGNNPRRATLIGRASYWSKGRTNTNPAGGIRADLCRRSHAGTPNRRETGSAGHAAPPTAPSPIPSSGSRGSRVRARPTIAGVALPSTGPFFTATSEVAAASQQ